MSINRVSLIFIWLLPLTASSAVTPGQSNNFTNVMTGRQVTQNKATHDQLTTPEASSLNPLSEVSAHNITQSIIADVNPTEEKAPKPSTKPLLQTMLTRPPKTFLPGIQTAASPTNSTLSQINSSTVGIKSTTEVQFKVTTPAITVVTSHASIPTATTRALSMLSSSTQSQFTRDNNPSTHPMQSTNLTSTTSTSTKHAKTKSTSTSHVTSGDTMKVTGLYKTSAATTKTPFSHITKAKKPKKRQDPPEKKAKSNKGTDHSTAVAGIIGGALVLMMVGFLAIYIKKQKLQRQQIMTTDWAGPSPFLESGVDNGQVTLRSSNRISLYSFLPQSLTKRLSVLQETDEELKDMTPGSTFGDKHRESTTGREVDGNDTEESNGTAVVAPEMKSTGDAPETVENSVTSSQTAVHI